MGKSLIQQKRGKGTTAYRRPSFRFKGEVGYRRDGTATVTNLLRCQAHSAPLAEVTYMDKTKGLIVAPEGMKIGDHITITKQTTDIQHGNTLPLGQIPEGTPIHNIEHHPGDGGKFVRAGGGAARIITKSENKIIVMLPSKKRKVFQPRCRATIGVVAGGGRTEKPLLKAGAAFHRARAKNLRWPKMRGAAQNAVNHPFGNKRTSRKANAKPTPRNAPPGRKVGSLAAKRTGRKRGKQ
jgi:large subunit ribosomal protein L2